MTINLFRDLNQEWSLTANSRRAAESLERWKAIESVLTEFSDLSAILDRAHDPDRSRRDDVMAALVRLGRQDPLAWRVVLHVVMPGMICTARRFSSGAHSQDEVAATVVTAAWERIAEYPLDRRPRNIGGNIALDTRQIASRRLFRNSGVEIPTEELAHYRAAPVGGADPAVTLVRLLDRGSSGTSCRPRMRDWWHSLESRTSRSPSSPPSEECCRTAFAAGGFESRRRCALWRRSGAANVTVPGLR